MAELTIGDILAIKNFKENNKLNDEQAKASLELVKEIKKLTDELNTLEDLQNKFASEKSRIENIAESNRSEDERKNLTKYRNIDDKINKKRETLVEAETNLSVASDDKVNYTDDLGKNVTNRKGVSGAIKGLGAKMVVDAINKVASDAVNIYVAHIQSEQEQWKANQDVYLKSIETGGKIFQRKIAAFGKGMQGALSSTFSSITQGVQEGAYSAAKNSVDYSTEMLKNRFENDFDRQILQNYRQTRQAEADLAKEKLLYQQINSGANIVGGVASLFGPVGAAIGGLVTTIASASTKIAEAQSTIRVEKLKKQIELAEKELEQIKEAQKAVTDQVSQTVNTVLEFSNSIETLTKKTDAAAHAMGNVIGMSTSNIPIFKQFVYETQRNLKFTTESGNTVYLDKNSEDMMKAQTSYIEQSGRNITMSKDDYIRNFQLGTVLGDDNLATALLGDMDYFNKSIESGTDLIYDMFQQANKAGVSNRKFAKDLQQNLKLAQKYTFKGGVKAMMEMSIWAQKTRFNMQSLEGMVDKIQDGGLEGVITQGAKLQVLGGKMAMGSDPLAMAYEAWNDPEGLAKRFNEMTSGVGVFNSKTGEVDIQGADAMRLKAFAEASGMDYKDARAQVTQRIKGEQIDKQLTQDYTTEQRALLYNKAQLNQQTGEWEVTLDNGEKKSVNDLGSDDFAQLMPTEESIEHYVAGIYDLMKQEGGVTKYSQAVSQDDTRESLETNVQKRIQDNLDNISNNGTKLAEMVTKSYDFVTAQNKNMHEQFVATSSVLDEQFDIMKKSVKLFSNNLQDETSEISTVLKSVRLTLESDLLNAEINKIDDSTEEGKKLKEEKTKLKEKVDAELGKTNDKLKEKIVGASEKSEYNTNNAINWSKFDNNGLSEYLNDTNKGSEEFAAHGINFIKEANEGNYQNAYRQLSDLAGFGWSTEDEGYDTDMTFAHLLDAMEYLRREGIVDDKGIRQVNDKNEAVALSPEDIVNDDFIKQIQLFREQFGEILSTNINSRKFDDSSFGSGDKLSMVLSSIKRIPTQDGIISSNGSPMITQATNVTKVEDGTASYVQSDQNDSALFAKDGGPFDKLFNGVFGKINDVYSLLNNTNDSISNNVNNTSYMNNTRVNGGNVVKSEISRNFSPTNSSVSNYSRTDGTASYVQSDPNDSALFAKDGGPFDKLFNGVFGKINDTKVLSKFEPRTMPYETFVSDDVERSYKGSGTPETIKIEPIKLEMSGRLELSSNGQTIDIMKEIQNNPLLLRQLTQMISETLSSKLNGGKSVFNGNNNTYFK